MSIALRNLAAEASDRLALPWVTIQGKATGQCSCRLGIWSGAATGEPVFTPTHWQWTAEELLAATYGRFLLETAMAGEI